MNWLESLRMGLKGLAVHKVRAALSMLGIVFGVASVVAVVAVGAGGKQEVQRLIEAQGATNIRVKAQNFEDDLYKRKVVRKLSEGLTLAEAHFLGENFPVFVAYAPIKYVMLYKNPVNVRAGEQALSTPAVVGTTPSYLDVMGYSVREGRFLTEGDERAARRVCVIEEQVRRELWPSGSPLGETLFIDNEPYEVVGALELKLTGDKKFEPAPDPDEIPTGPDAESSSNGRESDVDRLWKRLANEQQLNRRIYIPLSCALSRTTRTKTSTEVDEVAFRARSVEALPVAKDIIMRHLISAHRMSGLREEDRDFRVEVPMDLIRQAQTNQRIFNWVIGATAGISLLVGGIGIMNIMLANVTERRREIGIRRAVGASEQDILRQFIIEAVGICIFGGIVGVFVGAIMSKAVSWLAGYSTSVALWGVVAALVVSIADGLAFGTYPAYKAAKLDPIEALRDE